MENTHLFIEQAGYEISGEDGVEIFLTPEEGTLATAVEKEKPHLEGAFQNSAITYLTSEASDCPILSKVICGISSEPLPDELQVFFPNDKNAVYSENTTKLSPGNGVLDNGYTFTLMMGLMEGNEYKTSALTISGRGGALMFNIISETNGEVNLRKVYMTSFDRGMQPVMQEQSLVEGDPVWNCYIAALTRMGTINDWRKPDICDNCPLDVLAEKQLNTL